MKGILERIIINKSIKNGFIFVFFSMLNNGLNFLLLFVLAKYLLPKEYGNLSLYNNFISIITIFSTLGTLGYISVAYYKRINVEFKYYVTAIINVLILVQIILLILSYSLNLTSFLNIGLDYKYQFWGIVYCFFQFFVMLILEIWRLEEKPYYYGMLTTLIVVLNFAITFVLLNISVGWLSRVYSQIVIAILISIWALTILYRKGVYCFNIPLKKYFKRILFFGLPIIPHLMSVWVRQGLDSYIINYYYGAKEVGLYFFALNFSNLIYVLGSAFNSSNSIETYKILSEGYSDVSRKLFRKQNLFISGLFIVVTIVIILMSLIIIPLLFPQYNESMMYILPLCVSGFFQIVYLMFVNVLFFYSRTKSLMLITILFSIVHCLISLLITKYSLLYLSVLSLFINFLIAISVMYCSCKELHKHYV